MSPEERARDVITTALLEYVRSIPDSRADIYAKFAAAIRAAVAEERERCADIADQHASIEGIAQRIAAAIREEPT